MGTYLQGGMGNQRTLPPQHLLVSVTPTDGPFLRCWALQPHALPYPSYSTQERWKIYYCLDFTVKETEAEHS